MPASPRARPNQPLSSSETSAAAPFTPWEQLYAYLRAPGPDGRPRFQQGDHVAIIGPTGTGKTHIAFAVAEIRSYVIVVACKPKDPLIDDAIEHGYWLAPGHGLEIPMVDGRPLHERVVLWPRLDTHKLPPARILEAEKQHQRRVVAGAIGYVREHGKWCLVLDEGGWVCRDLALQRDVDSALNQFRTLQASVIILGQRPSWMGQYVLSQPTHLFLFQTSHTDDLKRLGDIAGVDTKVVQHLVRHLDTDSHEALYVNTRERTLMRTVAPPR